MPLSTKASSSFGPLLWAARALQQGLQGLASAGGRAALAVQEPGPVGILGGLVHAVLRGQQQLLQRSA